MIAAFGGFQVYWDIRFVLNLTTYPSRSIEAKIIDWKTEVALFVRPDEGW